MARTTLKKAATAVKTVSEKPSKDDLLAAVRNGITVSGFKEKYGLSGPTYYYYRRQLKAAPGTEEMEEKSPEVPETAVKTGKTKKEKRGATEKAAKDKPGPDVYAQKDDKEISLKINGIAIVIEKDGIRQIRIGKKFLHVDF
ncbi:MAG: hypothetical protein PW786_13020 [Arachidicoccus sp.]|nr:hypothetical protein [Arachidicoccus sp.]